MLDGFRVPGFDPRLDSWLVLDPRGQPAGFGIVEPEAVRVVGAFGRVHPEHRGAGSRLPRRRDGDPRRRDAHGRGDDRVVRNSVTSTDAAARRLLDDRGYALVRFFWHMERALRRADARIDPNGSAFDIRMAESEDELRSARVALDEAFRGHWMVQPWAFDDWRRHLVETSASVVRLGRPEVAGVVTWMPTSSAAWIEEVGVREPYRGRGLGGLLLRTRSHA